MLSGLGIDSDELKMIVPKVYVDRVARVRLVTPQVSRHKAHRGHMLGLFAETMRIRIRKDKYPVVRVPPSRPFPSHSVVVAYGPPD